MGLASAYVQPKTGALSGLHSRPLPGLATVTASLSAAEVTSVETWARSSAGAGIWRTTTQSSQEPNQSHGGRRQGKKQAPYWPESPESSPSLPHLYPPLLQAGELPRNTKGCRVQPSCCCLQF